MKTLHQTGLALAVAAGLLSTQSVMARGLDPGESHTVGAGDIAEQWRLEGAHLTLNPNSEAQQIMMIRGATLQAEGASILGDVQVNQSSAVLKNALIHGSLTVNDGSSGSGSTADVADSTIVGESYGLGVRDGQASISNTSIVGRAGVGAQIRSEAIVEIRSGSSLTGAENAAMFGFYAAGSSGLVVDSSHLESSTGAALLVKGDAVMATEADIELNNGTTVSAGNGVLLETEGNAIANLTISNSVINGDILNDKANGAVANIDLRNNAVLTGAMRDASSVSLDAAQWNVTGDSSVDSLQLGAGSVVAFQAPAGTHKILTVGDFTGAGGTLVFNTVLGYDNAASDKLVVTGDTSGTANVRVNNVGGAGALTTKGIELINVDGASNGHFDLLGRAVGGAYEYFLFKDGKNWYLRSQSPATGPEPCDLDPSGPWCDPDNPGPGPGTGPGDGDPYPMPKPEPGDGDPYPLPGVDPEYPDPIQRPEGGAYLANLQAAQQMFRTGYRDRQPGQNAARAWAKVDGSRSRFDASSRQLDVSGNSQSLSVGANLWQHDRGSAAGVMLSSGNATSTSTNELTGYYARGKVKGEALGVYGTWRGGNATDPNAGFYMDGSLQRAQFRNRVEGVGLEAERYKSRAWQGAVEAGYAFRVGGASTGGIYLEPQLQLGYSRVSVGQHTEANGTVVQAHRANGLFGRAGARLSGAMQWGDSAITVQPYVAVNWLYNGADASVRMNDEIVDARIPRNRAELSGGASVDFGNGFGAWGGVSLRKASGYHQSSAQVGLSYRW